MISTSAIGRPQKNKFTREIKPLDIFFASNKATSDRREQLVAERWAEYKVDQNTVHLAAICRELPFLDHPQAGQEIAHLLLA